MNASRGAGALAKYVVAGGLFGMLLVKAEVVSWYRIFEMFRFESFHMYGVLGAAMVTALVSVQSLTRANARALTREAIRVPPKEMGRGIRYVIGGFVFGMGWSLTGACPGPLFVLIRSGETVFITVGLAALAGTWTYGYVRPRLPH